MAGRGTARRGTALRPAILVGLVSLGLLVWLIVAVSSDNTRGFDLSVRDGVHHYASPAFTVVARWVTTLGSILFLSSAFVVSLAALLLARLRREAIRLTCVMTGAVGLENGLKFSIHRMRPDAFFGVDPTTYSFPSGHSLLSFCFYFTLVAFIARRLPPGPGRLALWTVTALLVAAIGLSRVYLGVHYPTDVVGGFLTAAFWISLVYAAATVLKIRARNKAPGS